MSIIPTSTIPMMEEMLEKAWNKYKKTGQNRYNISRKEFRSIVQLFTDYYVLGKCCTCTNAEYKYPFPPVCIYDNKIKEGLYCDNGQYTTKKIKSEFIDYKEKE